MKWSSSEWSTQQKKRLGMESEFRKWETQ
jgi:hypothetical protein